MHTRIIAFFKLSIKFCAILFAFTFLGVLIPLLFGRAMDDGRFVTWQKLPLPPEQVETLQAPDYVRSASGTIYEYSPVPLSAPGSCCAGRWEKVEAMPDNHPVMLPLKECGWIPNLEKYSDSVATCEEFGPGGTLTRILTRDQGGSLYSWTNGKGEGNALIIFYGVNFGAVIGFVVGLAAAIRTVLADRLRRSKAQTQT